MTPEISRNLNALGLFAVCGVLVGAFFYQFYLYELPCPLCLLQRVGFVAVGVGLAMNVIYGAKPRHYGIMLIAAIYGGSVSVRQILLHIIPGTGHYGSPVLGLHYYTWAAICFFLIILGTAVMLLFQKQYMEADQAAETPKFGGSGLAKAAFVALFVIAVANVLSAFLECGPGICDDPPLDYKLIEEIKTES